VSAAPVPAATSLEAFRGVEGPAGILLDLDGTLSPIVARPELARMAAGARETLADLAARFAVVAVVSGRTDAELVALVRVEGVRLEGSYGMGRLPDLPPAVMDPVRSAAERVPGARVEPKGHAVAVHVRGAADPEAAEVLLRAPLARIGEAHGLEVIEGKRVLELVPRDRPLKEGAVDRIVAEAGLAGVLYAGDDVADLRAFAALDRMAERGLKTVKVAVLGDETPPNLVRSADVTVDGPSDLLELLRGL
jgi:trehalose 6-phosphate phosphatase